jgi:hypothetical protein
MQEQACMQSLLRIAGAKREKDRPYATAAAASALRLMGQQQGQEALVLLGS